jgi:hypothetical protein
MTVRILQFSLSCCCFVPLRSKYSPQHPVLIYPQPVFLFLGDRRSVAPIYEGVSKSFRTGRLERGLQMVQLSATRCNYIAIL